MSSMLPSSWPNYRGNKLHTGLSDSIGPTISNVKFIFPVSDTISSSPAVDSQGNIYFGSVDNIFYKVSSTGSLIWTFDKALDDFNSSPALSTNEKIVFCGSSNSYLYALFTLNGSEYWNQPFQTNGPITASPYYYETGIESSVFVASVGGTIYKVDATSGNQVWTTSTIKLNLPSFDYSSPVLYNNVLYIGATANPETFPTFLAFDAITGAIVLLSSSITQTIKYV